MDFVIPSHVFSSDDMCAKRQMFVENNQGIKQRNWKGNVLKVLKKL